MLEEYISNIPKDCQKIIYDYYLDLESREKLKDWQRQANEEIRKEGIMTTFRWEIGYSEFYDINEAKYVLKEMNNCKCCDNHMKNRPGIKELERGYCPELKYMPIRKKITCLCPCRHISRWMCRVINDEIIEEGISKI